MLGTLFILLGAGLIAGMLVAGYYLASLACAASGANGCDKSILELISGLMIANEGILLWAAWVIGIFLIWGGMRLRARA
ncbi:MAG: hypothetical protein WCX93_13850 [Burkholderiaceae bacterium]